MSGDNASVYKAATALLCALCSAGAFKVLSPSRQSLNAILYRIGSPREVASVDVLGLG